LLLYKKILVALLGTLLLHIALESSRAFQIASAGNENENEEDDLATMILKKKATMILKKRTRYRYVVHGVKNLQMVR
jgi:hypothetical protein